MATPRRTCLGCGRPLSLLARPDQRSCSARCRLIAFRARRATGRPPASDLAQLAGRLEPHLSEVALVTGVASAAQQSWQAAAFLLERQYPERWGRQSRGEPDLDTVDFTEEDCWPSDAA